MKVYVLYYNSKPQKSFDSLAEAQEYLDLHDMDLSFSIKEMEAEELKKNWQKQKHKEMK